MLCNNTIIGINTNKKDEELMINKTNKPLQTAEDINQSFSKIIYHVLFTKFINIYKQ